MAKISVFKISERHDGRVEFSHYVSKSTMRSMLKHGRAQEIEQGGVPVLVEIKPVFMVPAKFLYFDGSKWRVMPELWNSFLNRGRAGQGIADYPVPYAFEGRLHNWHNPSGNQVKGEKFRRVNMSAPSE